LEEIRSGPPGHVKLGTCRPIFIVVLPVSARYGIAIGFTDARTEF
jgi:hypothetical protein